LEFIAWSAVAVALVAFDRAAWRSAPPSAVHADDGGR
jgi:hypothetical protein